MLSHTVLVDTPSLVLSFDQRRQCLCAEWKGPHDAASILAGCSLMRQSLVKQPCEKILDDSRQATHSWDEVAEWVGQDFFRILAERGIRYVAWVYPTDSAGRQSVELASHYARHAEVALFEDADAGYAWLQQQP